MSNRSFFLRLWCFPLGVLAFGSLSAAGGVDYLKQVKPLLQERCYACHGGLKQEGGLRLDTAELARQGGDSGAVVAPPEQADESELLNRVRATDVTIRMPPEHEGEPLSAEQIELLQGWIAAGAPGPVDEEPEGDPRDHWSFRPISRPEVPVSDNPGWIRNPIDAFVLSQHQKSNVRPQPEAPRSVLVRRLYIDLIGLAPTEAELTAALNSTSSQWYEELVDQLLEDPRHGERWARHWMDNWRYSDWWGLGEQLRKSQKHMWHWRDWIVESLNQDLPYDEMVRLMLAGDELYPGDLQKLRATGYLARNFFLFNRDQWMEETVEHTSKGLLGLTMNCAKCHDHKFDPIDQDHYYQLRAVFEPYQVRMDFVPGELNPEQDGIPRIFDGHLEVPTWKYIRGDESKPDQSHVITPGVPKIFGGEELAVTPVELPEVAWNPALRPGILETYLKSADARIAQAEAAREQAAQACTQMEKEVELANNQSASAAAETDTFSLQENFSQLDPAVWQVLNGKWVHFPGRMEQQLDGPQSSALRLASQGPQDFEASVRFQINGGSRWRSVGISFDSLFEPGTDGAGPVTKQQHVYLSAAAEDSKVQAAYFDAGQWHYPPAGRHGLKVELNREYTLQVRARGQLLNVLLDGQPVLTWKMPLARTRGAVQLTTFDAMATFYEFTYAPLDPNTVMDGQETPDSRLEDARHQLQLAEWDVKEAHLAKRSVQCRADAMRHESASVSSEVLEQSRIAAIQAERELAVVQAARAVDVAAQALKKVNRQDEKKTAAAEAALKGAQEHLAKTEEKFRAPIGTEDHYMPLVGSKWSATRFRNTSVDDPKVEFPKQSTGRRTALANWITARNNPLAARVAANHIWGRHFGEPIVATTFDFGRNGARPTHPELLDWLAAELMDNGWSMKHLHRLIVNSTTYRMSSSALGAEENVAIDPENRTLWRRHAIRLESQVVRDTLLHLAGTLDLTMGGPPVLPDDQEKSHRRSLYFFHSNNDRNLFLTMFDEAMVSECYRREQSIVPQQALALSNSELVFDSAERIAARISLESKDEVDFVQRAFLLLTGLEATPLDIDASLKALAAWQALPESSVEQARMGLVWTLINHNDFVTLR